MFTLCISCMLYFMYGLVRERKGVCLSVIYADFTEGTSPPPCPCCSWVSPQAFRENEEAKARLVDSYELMLGFYGIQLINMTTGEVKRADNWRERFTNLERLVLILILPPSQWRAR